MSAEPRGELVLVVVDAEVAQRLRDWSPACRIRLRHEHANYFALELQPLGEASLPRMHPKQKRKSSREENTR